jgi:hypothetical protein
VSATIDPFGSLKTVPIDSFGPFKASFKKWKEHKKNLAFNKKWVLKFVAPQVYDEMQTHTDIIKT